MSFACHSHVICMRSFFIYMYTYAIRMSVVCTRISSVRHSYVLVCNGMSLACTRVSSAFHSHVLLCHSYVLVCDPYVTLMHSYVIRMSLVCTRMSSVCHSYVLLCHSYVTCMWFYHEPSLLVLIEKLAFFNKQL